MHLIFGIKGRSFKPAMPFKHQEYDHESVQEVWKGRQLFLRMQARMLDLVREVQARGPLKDDDVSIAAHLLRLRDPDSQEALSEEILTGEFGVYFTAGIESAGNAMSWTL